MINRDHKLSLERPVDQLGISRGSLYYNARATSEDDFKLTRRIDELHMEYPFAGSRMMNGRLRQEGWTFARRHLHEAEVNPDLIPLAEHVQTGTRSQGLSLSAEKAGGDTAQSGLGDGHYLHSDGAWVRLSRRRAGLVQSEGIRLAALDNAGNWTMHRGFERGDAPPRKTTDHEHGSRQPVRINRLHQDLEGRRHPNHHGCQGRVAGNVFVERLRRTIKHEEVNLYAYDRVSVARERLARSLKFYNSRRPHSSLDGQTPD